MYRYTHRRAKIKVVTIIIDCILFIWGLDGQMLTIQFCLQSRYELPQDTNPVLLVCSFQPVCLLYDPYAVL